MSSLRNATNLPDQKAVKLSTYGIIYFGTPHQGAKNVPLAKLVLGIAKIHLRTSDVLLEHLDLHSDWLENEQSYYNNMSQDFDTTFAFESLPTRITGGATIEVSNPEISQSIDTYM
jgi:hypothetical protein